MTIDSQTSRIMEWTPYQVEGGSPMQVAFATLTTLLPIRESTGNIVIRRPWELSLTIAPIWMRVIRTAWGTRVWWGMPPILLRWTPYADTLYLQRIKLRDHGVPRLVRGQARPMQVATLDRKILRIKPSIALVGRLPWKVSNRRSLLIWARPSLLYLANSLVRSINLSKFMLKSL